MIRILTAAFLVLLLTSCSTFRATEAGVDSYRIKNDSLTDPALEAMIVPYREAVEDKMSVVLCKLGGGLERRKPESTMGNWFADAMFQAATRIYPNEVDMAIQNYGGLRRNTISAGDLTVGLVYEVMPFDNMLDLVKVKGHVLRSMCDNMARSGGWPVSKELRFEIHGEAARNITVGGKPLDEDRIYSLAMPDYVINLGERIGLDSIVERKSQTVLIRDVLIEHFRALDSIPPVDLDGRIKLIEQ
jgi:2',3'-cyclic-nucleotide 2'-phosphodiesterase (5'-nucleotidase family)